MTGTVITDLRRRGAVDPSRYLTGPLRVVGLQWLEPGHYIEVAAEAVEHALYVTAGSGTATAPDSEEQSEEQEGADAGIPLVEGTALTLPLGARTVLSAGTAGLEYFHAVLAVTGRPVSPGTSDEADADAEAADHDDVDASEDADDDAPEGSDRPDDGRDHPGHGPGAPDGAADDPSAPGDADSTVAADDPERPQGGEPR
ncbi:hypothetical protein ACFVHB_03425 [Kitasatospora sp. NPDC127111]|uniref:hypothetical protein n=1 Tax=Kitasatospora sp. NPDC127111 TaxID=3345363 RepID=UPI003637AFA6